MLNKVLHIYAICTRFQPKTSLFNFIWTYCTYLFNGFDSETVIRLGFTSFEKPVSVSQMECTDSLKRIWNRF